MCVYSVHISLCSTVNRINQIRRNLYNIFIEVIIQIHLLSNDVNEKCEENYEWKAKYEHNINNW